MSHTHRFASAFTLIEILVVVSIIGLISSVAFMRIEGARARSRDAVREQQIRQIDLATKLYVDKNGKPPQLTGCEAMQAYSKDNDKASACFAVSTASVDVNGLNAWKSFKGQISEFIAGDNIDDSLGYVYASPYALQYACYENNNGVCQQTADYFNQNYALFSQFETNDNATGNVSSDEADDLCGVFVSCSGGGNSNNQGDDNDNQDNGDTTAPQISGLTARIYRPTVYGTNTPASWTDKVEIIWTTDEPATSQVNSGSTQSIGFIDPSDEDVESYSLETVHSHMLVRMPIGSTYYYAAISKDESGNKRTSSVNNFKLIQIPYSVNGTGTVTVSDSSCISLASCQVVHLEYDTVTVTATPGSNWAFQSWQGVQCGTSSSCTFIANAGTSVEAVFVPVDELPPGTPGQDSGIDSGVVPGGGRDYSEP